MNTVVNTSHISPSLEKWSLTSAALSCFQDYTATGEDWEHCGRVTVSCLIVKEYAVTELSCHATQHICATLDFPCECTLLGTTSQNCAP